VSLLNPRQSLIVCVAFLTLGVLSAISYSFFLGHKMAEHYAPQMTMLVEIKLDITSAHLWLEEAMSGDKSIDVDSKVWSLLERAEQNARVLLGLEVSLGGRVIPLDEPTQRSYIEEVLKGVATLSKIARKRQLNKKKYGIGSSLDQHLDQRFDQIFSHTLASAEKVEMALQQVTNNQVVWFHRLQILLIITIVIFGLIMVILLQRYSCRRRQDMQVLRDSEEKFRAIFQSSVVGMIVVIDGDGLITEWNLGAEQAFGYSLGEVVGKPLTLLMPERFRKQHSQGFSQAVKLGTLSHSGRVHELAGQRKSGQEFPLELTLGSWKKGGKLYFSAIILDISKRKQSEDALQAERSFADSLVNTAQSIILVLDSEGTIVHFNPYMEKLSGFSLAEMQGKDWFNRFIPPSQYADVRRVFDETVANDQASSYVNSILTKSGNVREIEWHNTVLNDNSGETIGILAIGNDITKRKYTEQALRRSQKMDAIGQLTGGIAHDFNNILGIILGNIDLLKYQISDNTKALERLGAIEKSAQRAVTLTKQLLGFSCNQPAQTKVTDINQLIGDMGSLIRRSVTPEVEVEQQLSKGLWLTNIDPGDFQDALLNLIINARDAMPSGGQLIIETNNCHLDESGGTGNSGPHVELVVSDSGTGISPDVQEHVFEPFFTTKEPGKGTGLGLAMIFGFVQRSGGQIKLYSELGVGTTLRLYLPQTEGAQQPVTQPICAESKHVEGGNETILVVDDEEGLLKLAQDSLQALGYRVITACDASHALRRLADEPSVQLMFSDVVMPGGMNGYELAEEAVSRYEGLKILLTSGYTEKAIFNNGHACFSANLLSKPYSQGELARRIRRVLGVAAQRTLHAAKEAPNYNREPSAEWSEALSIGVREIDNDHQILHALLKQSQRDTANGNEAEVDGILKRLWGYTQYHFQREEAVMLACNYPEFDNHQQVHQLLAKQVEKMQKMHGDGLLSASELTIFLSDWLRDHIQGMDCAFAPYCKDKAKLIEQALEKVDVSPNLNGIIAVEEVSEEPLNKELPRKPRLVVVDDEADTAVLIAEIAEAVGFSVDTANSVKQYQKISAVQPYDVIVVDLIMPDIDGIELIRMLANQGSQAELIAISGYDKGLLDAAGVIAAKNGLNLRATFDKPIELNKMQSVLQEIILKRAEES